MAMKRKDGERSSRASRAVRPLAATRSVFMLRQGPASPFNTVTGLGRQGGREEQPHELNRQMLDWLGLPTAEAAA